MVFLCIVFAKSVHRSNPHFPISIYQYTIHLIINQCTGGTAMYIIRPFLLTRIILEQPVSLRREPDISIGILIYVHDPGTKISYSGKVILFPVIQVYSRHGSYPNTCFTVLKDSIRTASIKGSGISRFSCINPKYPCLCIQHINSPRISTNP